MRKNMLALAAASLLVAVVIGPPLYAEGSHDRSGSMMENGIMDRGASDKDKHEEGGTGSKMGMMGMMKKMSRMMDRCNDMMGDDRPNDQWRKDESHPPEQKG